MVSDDEVITQVRSMQQLASQLDHRAAEDAFGLAANQFGISQEQFASDPRVIEVYRRGFMRGLMRQKIIEAIRPDQRDNSEVVQTAIKQFISKSGIQIKISGIFDYPPEKVK